MFLDAEVEFSNSQAVTATAISTNVCDTQVDRLVNLGGLQPAYLVLQCDTTATDSGDDATVTVELVGADNAALTTNPTVMASFGALALATLVGGTTLGIMAMPFYKTRRYFGVRYTVASGPLTAGAFSAFVTLQPQFNDLLPANNPTAR